MVQLSFLAVLSGFGILFAHAIDTTTIKTNNGVIKGFTNPSFPNVAQFLGIPYAEPPIGKRRWTPAVPKKQFGTLNASSESPACPQSEPATTGQWAPEFLIKPNSTSEDCLYVDVWTPFKTSAVKEKLPVLVWIYGGGFVAGGIDIDYQIPSQWVSRSQKHIVVSFNYRVGVFGFPNAADIDLKKQNLGLLDQRLALEWVRDNISRFGGDPKRVTLWGQSAGAASVAYYQYAYPEDPIAHAFIQNSGGAYLGIASSDPTHSNFTSIAKAFKCDKGNQVDCLRKVPFKDIQRHIDTNSGFGELSFVPLVDEKTRFSDYTKRILSPKVAKFPNIIGTNRDEGSFGSEQEKPTGSAPTDQVKPDSLFTCPAHFETAVRSAANSKTWRYLYSGNFTNIMPGGEGSFHSAELPLIFGSHGIARGKSGPFEAAVSHSMQDHWLAFIQDPVSGLDKLGWKPTKQGGLDTLQTGVEFGFKNDVVRKYSWKSLQNGCRNATAV